MDILLSTRNLTKVFGSKASGFKAVDNVSFHIKKGEILGFLGPNGAGKTTTIQMLLGLITPTSGNIEIFGKDIKHHKEEILQQVNFSSAYVSLPTNLKVRENLYTFARLYGVKNYKARIQELVNFFDIKDLAEKMYGSLSSGQATRVNLAKAFLNSPRILFLDEPTASLDPDIADRTRRFLKKIQKEQELTILYTTHNMNEVEELCDRAIFINQGKIIQEGSPKELKKRFGMDDLNDIFIKLVRD